MKEIYKDHDILCLDISHDFKIYECYKHTDGVFFSAQCEAIEYHDIPLLIKYLEQVLKSKHERNLKRGAV
jgi:hypothetical protein